MGYAFISYSTKNQSSADAMRTLFNKHNIDTWMAPYDIPAGSKYAAVITRAIRDCSCFVLLLSNDSQESEAVDSEVELATLTYKKSIITVELEKVILNDSFTFYIHNKQIIAVHKIDENSYEVKQVLDAVKAYTKEECDNDITLEAVEDDNDKVTLINNGEKTFIETNAGRMILDNRYELGNILGQGGFGTVYKARDLKNQKNVAVKIGSSSAKKTIELHHSLIGKTNEYLCQIYDAAISSKGESYIVMEWFEEGKSLFSIKDYREFIKELGGDYPDGGHVLLLINILKGLKCLHSNGIVHADINPSNILTDGFVTKLIDYSSAFYVNTGARLDGEHTYIIGGYNSPEEKKDFRSDLYSVGMVAFKWLTGENPDVDGNGNLIFDNANIDYEAMLVLKKATMVNPDDRYQSADEFIDALKKYLGYFLDRHNADLIKMNVEQITGEKVSLEKLSDKGWTIKDNTTLIVYEMGHEAETEAQKEERKRKWDDVTKVIISEGIIEITKHYFWGMKNLQEVVFPSTLKKIGPDSFRECGELRKLEIPDGVEIISRRAFLWCVNLEYVKIPLSVKYIGDNAFSTGMAATYNSVGKESKLKDVYVNSSCAICPGNEHIKNVEYTPKASGKGWIIDNAQTMIIYEMKRGLETWEQEKDRERKWHNVTKVIISEGITEIAMDYFFGMENLREVVFPSTLKNIGADSFGRCVGLRKLELPDGLETISEGAFEGCLNLDYIKIPLSVKFIGNNAFSIGKKSKLKEDVYVNNSCKICSGNEHIKHILV